MVKQQDRRIIPPVLSYSDERMMSCISPDFTGCKIA